MQHLGGNLFWECNTKPNDYCIRKMKNTFIAEILNAWFTSTYDPTLNTFYDQILWNNSAVLIGKQTVFKKTWYDKGIKYVSDLLDSKKFISFHTLKEKFNIHCHFLEYYSLIDAIPKDWNRSVDRGEDFDSPQRDLLNIISSSVKVCKTVHKICVEKIFKTPKCEEKWAIFFSDMNLNWSEIYKIPKSSSRSTKLQYFQFKILHRYIGTSETLFKFGYVDSNLCTFCKDAIENIPHLFWQCDISFKFWKDVLDHVLKKKITLSMKDVILGIMDIDNSIYNFVILHAKYYIYSTRCNECKPDITAFKRRLKSIYTVEKMIADKNDRIEELCRKWNTVNIII